MKPLAETMMSLMPPMLPRMVTEPPRKMQIQLAQKFQFFQDGFLRMSQKMEGRKKVVGPVPRAPMKPCK